MNCCKHKYFVIYRGDDTDFPGNQELIVELNTERDLTGCSAHFSFQGFTQDFAEIPSDKKLRLVIPNSETGKFALGAADAKLWLTNGTKIRTVENRIHVVVTNNVNEAYNNDDPQAITVTISGGGSGATVVLDDTVTETSPNGVKSSGIWSWVKSLLPKWLTSDYAEPATVASVAAKANKATPSAAGNLAALTADGDIEDSGKTVDDFLPRVSDGPVNSTFDISGPLLLDMDGYIQLRAAGFIYGLFDNIREEMGSKSSLRTELDSKVDSFASVGGATATVENGVAKLYDFFTESNSLLAATIDARLPYPLNTFTDETGLLKDRAINTTSLAFVTVPVNFTDLIVRASVASSLSVTMPEAITTKYGDTFPGEAGEYLITITKTGAAEAYVRTIKLEEVANA